MFETASELAELQALIDRSFAASGAHLTSIVGPSRRLMASQVAAYLRGVKHVTFATVNSAGQPLAAPLDGWFIHGQFIVSTSSSALRMRHLRRNPAASLGHVVGDDIGIWAHGQARIATKGEPLVDEFDNIATQTYGSSPFTWGDIAVVVLEARAFFAYASKPETFASE